MAKKKSQPSGRDSSVHEEKLRSATLTVAVLIVLIELTPLAALFRLLWTLLPGLLAGLTAMLALLAGLLTRLVTMRTLSLLS
jgi:hypothetical protein